MAGMLAAAVIPWLSPAIADDTANVVHVVTIDGAIGPASGDYLSTALAQSVEQNARLLIIEMDTPGGLDSAMRDMIKAILASPVPVATFVSPGGSRAASAGTYILYGSHIAAMAPATNLGSATPVSITGDDVGKQDDNNKSDEEEGSGKDSNDGSTAMERKVINDAIAYIRGLAEKYGRNADWAEEAVRDAANLTAEEALELNVIDLIAEDIPDLLKQLNGRTVSVNNLDVVLDTEAVVVERIERDWRNKLIDAITNPSVAYMLLMLGIYGLMFEGYNPGVLVPGIVGAIAILLALYAFQILNVNYTGLALIALGIVLMIGEAMTPAFGVLGLGGIIAFVIGSVILMDSDVPGFDLDLTRIIPVAAVAALGTLGLSWYTIKNQYRARVSGVETLINSTGHVREAFVDGQGTIWIQGERWNAVCSSPVNVGDEVRVVSLDGLILTVEPTRSF
ncbi:MAG: nodulation protein NfeD [Gammaproteobacteria bacterium]|nr:nodulation protein NfeD [Gammaproteobacteria bacterium]